MTTPPTSLGQFQSNFTEMLPRWLSTKITKTVPLRSSEQDGRHCRHLEIYFELLLNQKAKWLELHWTFILRKTHLHFILKLISEYKNEVKFTSLWANLADDKLILFLDYFPQNIDSGWHFMQIVSWGDNLHEMPRPIFGEKISKIFQNVVC